MDMDNRLSNFLTYDYAQAQDLAKTLIAISGVALGAGIAFAEKFIRLQETDRLPILRLGIVGLYLLGSAIVFSAFGLVINYTHMTQLLHQFQSGIPNGPDFTTAVVSHNRGVHMFLFVICILIAAGLFCLLKAAHDNSPARHPREPAPSAEVPKP